MPGPSPTPTAVKKARGNPGKRPLNDAEPEAIAGRPKPPRGVLKGSALTEFNRLCDDLEAMGTLSVSDVGIITGAAHLWQIYINAKRKLDREGLTFFNGQNVLVRSPYLNIVNDALRDLRAFWGELGLSPAARTRVKVTAPKKKPSDDPIDEWMSLKGGKQ